MLSLRRRILAASAFCLSRLLGPREKPLKILIGKMVTQSQRRRARFTQRKLSTLKALFFVGRFVGFFLLFSVILLGLSFYFPFFCVLFSVFLVCVIYMIIFYANGPGVRDREEMRGAGDGQQRCSGVGNKFLIRIALITTILSAQIQPKAQAIHRYFDII